MLKSLALLLSLMFAGCSYVIQVHLSGWVIGIKESEKQKLVIQYRNFWGNGKENEISLDSMGRFDATQRFVNVFPMCMSLLVDGKIEDRYCVIEKDGWPRKEAEYRNIFDSTVLVGRLSKDSWEFNNIKFMCGNYKKDSLALIFDSASISWKIINGGKDFLFEVHDKSKRANRVNLYFPNSELNQTDVPLVDSIFKIDANTLIRGKSRGNSTIYLRLYSKNGWYKDFQELLWKE